MLKKILLPLISIFVFTPLFCQNNHIAEWTDISGVKVEHNKLIKSKNTNKWDSGVASINFLKKDTNGWINIQIEEINKDRMIGFSEKNKDSNWKSIDYALFFAVKGVVEIREKGSSPLYTDTYKTGDIFKIERLENIISYKKNDSTIYISSKKSVSELIVDVSMKTQEATLQNILTSFPIPQHSNDTLITKDSKNRQLEHWKIYNIRGKIHQEGNYLNNQKTGLWKTYHSNGKLQKLTQYQKSKIIGVEQEFTDTGIPIIQTNYQFVNDTLVEIISKKPKIEFLTIYNETGKLKYTGFLTDGIKTGIWREFDSNSNVKTFTTYQSDKKNGIHYIFDNEGGIIEEANYKNDVLKGKRVKYKVHGKKSKGKDNRIYKPMLIEHYKNGKLDGVFKNYYANGILQESSVYQNGIKNGISLWYHKTGELLSEFQYKNGVLVGSSKTYYPNSQIKTESNYVASKLTGIYKEYHDNGTIKLEGQYLKGKKDGIWQYYDVNGEKNKKEWYKLGDLIKSK